MTIPLIMVMVIGTGCDHLALEPHQSVSNTAYFQSMDDFRAALIGAYNQMQGSSWIGGTMTLVPDILSGDVKQSPQCNRWQEWSDYEGGAISGHDFEMLLWREVYQAMDMLNAVISREADFTPPSGFEAEFTQLIGEAYAIRALGHFDLVRMYAQHYTFSAGAAHPGVPIIIEQDINNLPARNTVAEVYAQVIADFTTAISKMTMTRSGPYLFTKEAVQALLSRVYLYMEDFTNSITMADAVINSGKYSLVSRANYVGMFAPGGSPEAILEIFNETVDSGGGVYVGRMYHKDGYGDYLPSKDLLNDFAEGDIRSGHYVFDEDLTGDYASMRVNKWPNTNYTDNVPVIRLSEVLLNRAEAYQRSGNDAGALADLNMIRERAFGDTDHNVSATGADLLAAILLERRLELANEGHAIFDITRHKKDMVRIDYTGDQGTVTYPNDYWIFPIPDDEMNVNANLVQNAGY